jgi:hypothetical protein
MGTSSSKNENVDTNVVLNVDTNVDPMLFTSDDITDMIKDSPYYNPKIEINPLIFEEIRYKILSYLTKMLRNIEILKKYSPNSSPNSLYSKTPSPKKLYFPKKAFQNFSNNLLIQKNLEYYISEIIDGALIIQKNNELMPGDINTYARSLVDTPDTPYKFVDLTQEINAVLFQISPDSTIDKEALNTINRLLNELAHRILSIAKKLKNKITISEMNAALEIVFETNTLRQYALLSKYFHFSPLKVLEIDSSLDSSHRISKDAIINLTSVLEYITAEILNASKHHEPITKNDVIQAIQNDTELDTLFRYL